MIKLKLSIEGGSPTELEIIPRETLEDAVTRILKPIPLGGLKAWQIFHVVLNGQIIKSELWPNTVLFGKETVVISPIIRGGESGQIFKQIVILTVAIYASTLLGPQAGFWAYAAVAAIDIGTALLMNALIPPPVPKTGDLGLDGGIAESQMYSLTGQSNSIVRFGTVPRVYGTHRIFPNVAAIPYTEMEILPATGELVQYLYAIYDFGLGPLSVQDIMIGDTALSDENFDDFHYRFVDFNRPDDPTEIWDLNLATGLEFYKGELEGTPLAIGLTGNMEDGDSLDSYEGIQNTAPNTDDAGQEIILNFACPQGLYGYSSTGVKDYRKINLNIAFSKVGEDNWKNYNDMSAVSHFTTVGGEFNAFEYQLVLAPTSSTGTDDYYSNEILPQYQTTNTIRRRQLIYDGVTKLLVYDNANLSVGSPIFVGNIFLGNIASLEDYVPNSALMTINLDRQIRSYMGMGAFYYTGTRMLGVDTWGAATYGGIYPVAYGHGPGRAAIQRSETAPVYSSFRFTPIEPGQYKVRVERVSTTGPYSTQIADALTWTSLTTRFDRPPITTDKRHVFMELKIRATGQLNGTVSNLSGVVSSVCDVWDGTTWSKQLTNNPAWCFTDLLIGEVNKKAVDKTRLDLDSLLEWAEYCDTVPDAPPDAEYTWPRFQSNFILDYSTTLQDALNQIAGSAQASLNIIDGKYGVLIDRLKTTPVQIFTPRNSKDFASSRLYGPRPHAVKVKFIDPNLNWDTSEVLAYDNGYTVDNATDIQEMTAFACTNQEQAWRFGRYMIAQNKLRQETITLLVDFENLVCTRGDYVQITQDVMRVGGTPARVIAMDGTIATIDDRIDIDPDLDYGYTFRRSDGLIRTSTLTSVEVNQFDLDGSLPSVGDLIVIGEVGNIVFDCIVKAISPNDDMSASLVLIEKADAIYDYESTDVLPDYDPQLSATSRPDFAPPRAVENLALADTGHDCAAIGIGYTYFADLSWDVPVGSIFEFFIVYVDDGRGFTDAIHTRGTVYHYEVDETRLDREHSFKVVAVSATGKKLALAAAPTVSYTPTSKSTPPSDVTALNMHITNEVLQLAWDKIDDCDSAEYLIRFSPSTNGSWASSVPLARVDRSVNTASVQARTGTYLIKAIDFNDNESAIAATAITTIPSLFNLNIIEEVNDAPAFPGSFDRTEQVGLAVSLVHEIPGDELTAVYYEEGYYYYSDFVDLGDIYSCRLQSRIKAAGVSVGDLMASWADLESVDALTHVTHADWDAQVQYRGTESHNPISDWASLSVIDSMFNGAAAEFSEWRTFTMGDATARILQFRIKLNSFKANVTPRVFDMTVRIDMPDRVDSFENLVADVTNGKVVTYLPAFNGPTPSPNVQISIDGAESGDYWAFDYKTLSSLLIRFYDKDDNPVERQFDIAIKGYGRKSTSVI